MIEMIHRVAVSRPLREGLLPGRFIPGTPLAVTHPRQGEDMLTVVSTGAPVCGVPDGVCLDDVRMAILRAAMDSGYDWWELWGCAWNGTHSACCAAEYVPWAGAVRKHLVRAAATAIRSGSA